jgi:hypothetical protein
MPDKKPKADEKPKPPPPPPEPDDDALFDVFKEAEDGSEASERTSNADNDGAD